ncbi:uncharacterized protein [Dermacentor albipictus]|uniref:uncharacterized protein n=1 Tax=Dermacentor albipictus TaxID=60249 RepID=UPI0038FD2D12
MAQQDIQGQTHHDDCVSTQDGCYIWEQYIYVLSPRTFDSPALLKDIRQLSPDMQTYSLESFHSVLNGYAPKSIAYTYQGMKARTLIAALHVNENANREQATTKDGTQPWHSKTSKARHIMMTVCPLKMAVTFGKFCVTSVFQLAVLLYKCSTKLRLTLHLQAIHKLMLQGAEHCRLWQNNLFSRGVVIESGERHALHSLHIQASCNTF